MKTVAEYSGFGGFTIQQIEIFLTVARYLNYSRAAKELYISQPAVSSWIMKMEEAWGVRLFNRLNRGVELTDEGLRLYSKLEHIYQRFRVSVNVVIREMHSTSKFDIGCLDSDTFELANKVIGRFCENHEEADVYNEVFNYHELREKLICGELDIIFTVFFDVENQSGIKSKPIGSIPQFFFFPKKWEKSGAGIGETLSGRDMILEIHNGEKHFREICQRYGVVPSSVRFSNSYLDISKKIADGNCFTIGGSNLSKTFNHGIGFLPHTGFEETIAVAWREDNDNPWLDCFLEMI